MRSFALQWPNSGSHAARRISTASRKPAAQSITITSPVGCFQNIGSNLSGSTWNPVATSLYRPMIRLMIASARAVDSNSGSSWRQTIGNHSLGMMSSGPTMMQLGSRRDRTSPGSHRGIGRTPDIEPVLRGRCDQPRDLPYLGVGLMSYMASSLPAWDRGNGQVKDEATLRVIGRFVVSDGQPAVTRRSRRCGVRSAAVVGRPGIGSFR